MNTGHLKDCRNLECSVIGWRTNIFFEADHPDLHLHYYCCTILVVRLGMMVHESRSTVRPQSIQTLNLFCSSSPWLCMLLWQFSQLAHGDILPWAQSSSFPFHLESALNFSSWTVFWGRSVRIVILRSSFLGNDFYYKLGLFYVKILSAFNLSFGYQPKHFWFQPQGLIHILRSGIQHPLHIRLIAFLSAPQEDILNPNTSLVSG